MSELKEYLEITEALRDKYEKIRFGNINKSRILEKSFEPLIKRIQPLQQQPSSSQQQQQQHKLQQQIKYEEKKLQLPSLTPQPSTLPILEKIASLHGLAKSHLKKYFSPKIKTDTTFGLHTDGEDFFLGNQVVSFRDNNISVVHKTYEGTPGFWDLLTSPIPLNYSEDDLAKYEDILLTTETIFQKNDANTGRVKSSKSDKYKSIIRPILIKHKLIKSVSQNEEVEEEEEKIISGKGLQKILTNMPVEYVYWNSLDELLECLYIVYSEIKAGNNNPNLYNELVNILMEIKEIR